MTDIVSQTENDSESHKNIPKEPEELDLNAIREEIDHWSLASNYDVFF